MRGPLCSLAILVTAGCSADSSPRTGEEGAGGKADATGEAAVTRTEASEALYSDSLKERICGALQETEMVSCSGLTYTVAAKYTSDLYAHQMDGKPITMRLDVEVTSGSESWDAVVSRTLDSRTFELGWRAHIENLLSPEQQLIQQIADITRTTPEDHPDLLTREDFDVVPSAILDAAETRAIEITEEWMADGLAGAAEVDRDQPAFLIVYEAEERVIGYVIHLTYYVEDPLFSDGGRYLYLDLGGNIAAEHEWFG